MLHDPEHQGMSWRPYCSWDAERTGYTTITQLLKGKKEWRWSEDGSHRGEYY